MAITPVLFSLLLSSLVMLGSMVEYGAAFTSGALFQRAPTYAQASTYGLRQVPRTGRCVYLLCQIPRNCRDVPICEDESQIWTLKWNWSHLQRHTLPASSNAQAGTHPSQSSRTDEIQTHALSRAHFHSCTAPCSIRRHPMVLCARKKGAGGGDGWMGGGSVSMGDEPLQEGLRERSLNIAGAVRVSVFCVSLILVAVCESSCWSLCENFDNANNVIFVCWTWRIHIFT